MSNPFFKNEGPFEASFLCQIMNIDSNIYKTELIKIDLEKLEELD